MAFKASDYGHIDHLTVEISETFGPLEAAIISGRLITHGGVTRGKKLNKWALAYLAEEIAKDYPGFDLFVIGYFGDGDGELRFD